MSHPLEEKIGYHFQDESLLNHALTHSSWSNEKGKGHLGCNERLEFLGDSVLGFVSARYLYGLFPEMPEGMLTKIRSELVCESSLAEVAAELKLGDYLLLGRGEEKNGGRSRPSMSADAVEAVIAAIFLDGGFSAAKDFIMRFILTPQKTAAVGHDYKSELQERIQREPGHILRYETLSEEGPDHDKVFHVAVFLDENRIGEGTGPSKKKAEQASAQNAIERYGENAGE